MVDTVFVEAARRGSSADGAGRGRWSVVTEQRQHPGTVDVAGPVRFLVIPRSTAACARRSNSGPTSGVKPLGVGCASENTPALRVNISG